MRETKYVLLLAILAISLICAYTHAHDSQETPSKLVRLSSAFKEVRFVSYTSSRFSPLPDGFVPAAEPTILEDLKTLRPYFDGLITYSCDSSQGVDKVIPIAAKLQYKAAIIGIWDIRSEEELDTAINLAREYPALIVGVIVGNEGITRGPRLGYDYPALESAIRKVRRALPYVAVSTSEPIGEYGDEDLLRIVDFHSPNIHPWFAGTERRRNPRLAVDYVKRWIERLRAVSDKPCLLHEAGLPSGPEPHASPGLQRDFWGMLFAELPNTGFFNAPFWEAFDAGDWKTKTNPSDISEVESRWGGFENLTRNPKPVVEVLPGNDKFRKGAYQHLNEVIDRYHQAFNVYTDAGAAGNHFVKIAKMASAMDEDQVNIDIAAEDDPKSGASCIRCSFTALDANWGGCYFQNGVLLGPETQPSENWGEYPDAGFNLNGAEKLTFWARSGDSAWVEFFAFGIGRKLNTGSPISSYPDSAKKISTGYICLSKEWRQYSIDLRGLDLVYVIGGFGWVTSAPYNPDGTVFYLDEIKYELSKDFVQRRQNEPHFLVSFVTESSNSPFDTVMRNVAFTYDNAMALLAYIAADDRERAEVLAEAFIRAQERDRYFSDGRIRNAYQGGDLLCPPGWRPNGRESTTRIPGHYSANGEWYEDYMQVGAYVGNMAWAMIALVSYHDKYLKHNSGNSKYLEAAKKMGEWIYRNCYDAEGLGGYTGGYNGWGVGDNQYKVKWKSMEHNLDLYAIFLRLHKATGEEKWKDRAEHARRFVEAAWSEEEGRFYTGSDDGVTLNEEYRALDVNTWALLVLGVTERTKKAIEWVEKNCKVTRDGCEGFDFNDDRDAVWWEGTAQMVVVYKMLGEKSKALNYLDEMRRAQFFLGNSRGIPAASHDNLTTGLITKGLGDEEYQWLYYKRLHIAATAWFVFAELGRNPYWLYSDIDP